MKYKTIGYVITIMTQKGPWWSKLPCTTLHDVHISATVCFIHLRIYSFLMQPLCTRTHAGQSLSRTRTDRGGCRVHAGHRQRAVKAKAGPSFETTLTLKRVHLATRSQIFPGAPAKKNKKRKGHCRMHHLLFWAGAQMKPTHKCPFTVPKKAPYTTAGCRKRGGKKTLQCSGMRLHHRQLAECDVQRYSHHDWDISSTAWPIWSPVVNLCTKAAIKLTKF